MANRAPRSTNDFLTASEDTSFRITPAQLLGNDADDDGDLLHLLAVRRIENCVVSIDEEGNVLFNALRNFSGQASFSYTVADPSGARSVATVFVSVDALADSPRLRVADSLGREDGAIRLHISAALLDRDGSESLKVYVSGVPEGASLSAGTLLSDGSWELTSEQLLGLTITPAANSDADFDLTVRAVSTEASNGSQADTIGAVHVKVDAKADLPVLVVSDAVGVVGTPIALDISAALTDTDGSESLLIMILGVPKLATLSAGTRGDDGIWTLSAEELDGLTLTPAAVSASSFKLAVRAIATEEENGSVARVVQTLMVTVNHAPLAADDSASVSEGDASISGNVLANDSDSDAGSTLLVAVPGTYAGAYGTLVLSEDGSYTYTLANVDALAEDVTVQDSFTYRAKDQHGALSANATLTLSITGTNDAALLGSAVVELAETNAPLSATGSLSISDVDSPAVFVAQSGVAGDNGTFSVDTAGNWTYTADSAFDYLNTGDSASDTFQVSAADGTTTSVKVTINGTNDAPVITSATSASVAENQTAVMTITANDPDAGAALSYAITGGADAEKFSINASTGALSFLSAPNYEAPTDAGSDNHYEVNVTVSDGTLGDMQAITVIVANVSEPPVITSNGGAPSASVDFLENRTAAVTTFAATAPAGPTSISYSLSGDDAALFSINAAGALAFLAAPNFEIPADAGGDNEYHVTVIASADNSSDQQDLAVKVLNVFEPVVITSNGGAPLSVNVNENQTAVTTITAAIDATRTLALSLSGPDAAKFSINSLTGLLSFSSPPNFEAPNDASVPGDAGANNVYHVTANAWDGISLVDQQTISVRVTNVNEGGPSISVGPSLPWEQTWQFPAFPATGRIQLADVDGVLTSATVTLADHGLGDYLTFTLPNGSGLAGNLDSATGVLTISGTASTTVYEQALQAVSYHTGYGMHTVALEVSDGEYSASVSKTVDVVRFVPSGNTSEGFSFDGGPNGAMYSGNPFVTAGAGDVNGDGYDDILMGSSVYGASGDDVARIRFGGPDGGSAQAATTIYQYNFQLAQFTWEAGSIAVAAAGDVNRDGFDDFIVVPQQAREVGAIFPPVILPQEGPAFLRYGGTTVERFYADSTDGAEFSIGDAAYETIAAGAGDVNGDGFDDLIVGKVNRENPEDATAYIVLGGTGVYGIVNLASMASSSGYRLEGGAGNDGGHWADSVGDVNGDGYDDVIVGASIADPNGITDAGASYVVYGKPVGTNLDVADLAAADGFRIEGVAAGDHSGASVRGAGDVNGDGYDDVIIGAPDADPNGEGSGAAYVVFGRASSGNVNLASLDGANGFKISGVDALDALGTSVSGAGDLDGDGYDDLLIGAPNAYSGTSLGGVTYVIFGAAEGFGANIEVSALGAERGYRVIGNGFDGSFIGWGAAAGDVNGDGTSDFVDHDATGEGFVLYGGESSPALPRITGTTGNDTLTGTSAAEVLVGGVGGDTLKSNGGADVLIGGDGVDRIELVSADFAKLDGNSGNDVVVMDGSDWTLDLTLIPNSRIESVESFDLSGGGHHTLRLDKFDVLDVNNHQDPLSVLGSAGDTVELSGGGWTYAQSTSGGQTWNLMRNDAATLLVDTRMAIVLLDGSGIILTGGPGADTLVGGAGNDGISGGAGVDSLTGGLGDDVIYGNDGDDSLTGGRGNDFLDGGTGHDLLQGREDDDVLVGGAGNDTLQGGQGDDTLEGGTGNDSLVGGTGFNTASYASATAGIVTTLNDDAGTLVGTVSGGAGTDSLQDIQHLIGSDYADDLALVSSISYAVNLEGRGGNDAINGAAGDDTLDGGDGDDVVVGFAGNDTLTGGAGNDQLSGGAGADQFIFDADLGVGNVDTITDFVHGTDKIALEHDVFSKPAIGALASGNFVSSSSGNAVDTNDFILYENDTGKLFYDSDGSGAGAKVQFATVTGHPALTSADFLIVG